MNTPKVCGNLRSCKKFNSFSRFGFAKTMGSLQDAIRFYESHIHFWVDPSFQHIHFKHHHLKKPPLPQSLASSASALSIDLNSRCLCSIAPGQYPRGGEWRGLWWALSLKLWRRRIATWEIWEAEDGQGAKSKVSTHLTIQHKVRQNLAGSYVSPQPAPHIPGVAQPSLALGASVLRSWSWLFTSKGFLLWKDDGWNSIHCH